MTLNVPLVLNLTSEEEVRYTLVASISHRGNTFRGHYVSRCKRGNSLYLIDDTEGKVSPRAQKPSPAIPEEVYKMPWIGSTLKYILPIEGIGTKMVSKICKALDTLLDVVNRYDLERCGGKGESHGSPYPHLDRGSLWKGTCVMRW